MTDQQAPRLSPRPLNQTEKDSVVGKYQHLQKKGRSVGILATIFPVITVVMTSSAGDVLNETVTFFMPLLMLIFFAAAADILPFDIPRQEGPHQPPGGRERLIHPGARVPMARARQEGLDHRTDQDALHLRAPSVRGGQAGRGTVPQLKAVLSANGRDVPPGVQVIAPKDLAPMAPGALAR